MKDIKSEARTTLVEELEAEGVLVWGDPGQRDRFLTGTAQITEATLADIKDSAKALMASAAFPPDAAIPVPRDVLVRLIKGE